MQKSFAAFASVEFLQRFKLVVHFALVMSSEVEASRCEKLIGIIAGFFDFAALRSE
jgi:hypothetical protein